MTFPIPDFVAVAVVDFVAVVVVIVMWTSKTTATHLLQSASSLHSYL